MLCLFFPFLFVHILLQPGLNKDLCEFVRRFGPENAEEDSIGFFISKFKKKCSINS